MKKKVQTTINKGQLNVSTPEMKAASHTPEANAKRTQTMRENKLIQAELYSHLKEALLDGTNTPYYAKFIDKYLKEAYANPNGPCGKIVACSIFSEDRSEERRVGKECRSRW